MKHVLSSATKAELGAIFHNFKEACPLQIALTEMGHPQNATTLSSNNSTAAGIFNSTIKKTSSKSHHAAIWSTYILHSVNPARNYFQLLSDDKEQAPT
jgi:hypothetical protein